MGFRKINRDVKLAAIQLHERNLLSLRDILDSCGFSESTWFRIFKLWHETGDVVNRQPSTGMRGRLRALDREDIDCLLRLVRQNPAYFSARFTKTSKSFSLRRDKPGLGRTRRSRNPEKSRVQCI
ncbi:hypothetical protein DFH29DRAFT_923943 [Suillus ampliporus]|nr:hypothetical protein DFH29DRAFT_923943 [Suillus ampliporus]